MSAAETPPPDVEGGPGHWLNDLRFHLGPNTHGRMVFSHVHLDHSHLNRRRELFLQDLMTGRTIPEVLTALTPSATASGTRLPDCTTAADLRQYFHRLALQLHLLPADA